MKDLFVNKTFNFIDKYQHLDNFNQIKIRYGLEVFYHFFTKTSVILVLSLIEGTFKYLLLFLIFYTILRTVAKGVHAKTNIGCWITSIVIFSAIGYFIKFINIPTFIQYYLWIFSLISFFLWSPSDTEKNPLLKSEIRYFLKTTSIIISFLYVLFILIFNKFSTTISLALFIEAININPLIYKITGNTYKNHEE